MHRVLLSLSREELPVQYGVTAGSLVERFFQHAVQVVGSAASIAPPDASGVEVETEFEGVFFTYFQATPRTLDVSKDTEWVANFTSDVDWIEAKEVNPDAESRAVILRIRSSINTGDMYFVATSSEEFMTTLILSQTPG